MTEIKQPLIVICPVCYTQYDWVELDKCPICDLIEEIYEDEESKSNT